MGKTHRLDHSPFIVPPGKPIRLKDHDPGFTSGFKDKAEAQAALLQDVSGLVAAQDLLWASKQYSVIIIFQALDAAGKDGTIKHVMSGVNPQGVTCIASRRPTEEERLHHFLWRPMRVAPARGQIAIFNRSYYEEVLVVRVHPELLDSSGCRTSSTAKSSSTSGSRGMTTSTPSKTSRTATTPASSSSSSTSPSRSSGSGSWSGSTSPEKNWKFSAADLRERAHWDEYQAAYEDMLNATSTETAPWYVIPADKKWFTRACVADIITSRIAELDLKYPEVSEKDRAALAQAKVELESEAEN